MRPFEGDYISEPRENIAANMDHHNRGLKSATAEVFIIEREMLEPRRVGNVKCIRLGSPQWQIA